MSSKRASSCINKLDFPTFGKPTGYFQALSSIMRFLSVVAFGLHFHGLLSQDLDANGVSLDQKVLAIERLLLTPGTINFPVQPCELNLNSAPNSVSGDQTAAQWVRTVFHDFITADVKAGTG